MFEWADYYQRIVVQDVGNETHLIVVFEDEDGVEHESSVWLERSDFRKMVKELASQYVV